MTHITRSAHTCKPANTTTASLEFDGISIDVTGFDMTPETRAKVRQLTEVIDGTLRLMELTRQLGAPKAAIEEIDAS